MTLLAIAAMDGVEKERRLATPELLRRALPFVAPHRTALLVIVSMSLASAGLGAFEPLVLKSIFDELGSGHAVPQLAALAAVLFALLVCKEGLAALLDRRIWRVRIAVHESITRATVDRLHALPLAYHRQEGVGAIIAKMDRGINGAVAAFSDVAFHMVPTLAYLVMSVVIMWRLEWRVTLLVCAFVPLPPLVGVRAAREQTARERTLMDRWTRLFARFNEVLSAIAVVKSFAVEEMEKRRFLSGVEEANEVVVRGVETDSRTTAAKNFAVILARISAVAVGGWLIARGELSLGGLVAFLGYLGGLFGPVQGLTGMMQAIQRGTVGLETIYSILDAKDPLRDAPDAIALPEVRGEVEFRGVVFGYRPDCRVVRGVDLRVRPGETVALVGPSGAGKTTLMALLQRQYDVDDGQVLIDGVDVRRLTQKSLREHIGVVPQDDALFSDSARANIGIGKPGASIDEIERAARDARAHEFIAALPDGYDTPLGYGATRLSAGQRQRIAIARALLKDPAILVLDEATSALDAESEALVQEATMRLKKGRTTFVIAHRLATITSADRIVVVRDGRIVEIGSHDDLVARSGHYALLVARQVRGLVEGGA
jgi:ATP-binding cassette, subfamily B, bacterial